MPAHNTRRVSLILLGLTLGAALPACVGRVHSMQADVFAGSEAVGNDQRAMIDRAKAQVAARAKAAGLEVEEPSRDRLRIFSAGPVTGAAAGGAGGGVPASIAQTAIEDNRRVAAWCTFENAPDGIRYRYRVSLTGAKPANTTPDHERRVFLGLCMVREIFESPLAMEAPGRAAR